MRILSLGAGVQSSCILLMSCRGVLPKLDAAIFADTQFEPAAVYDNLQFLIDEAAKNGIPVHVRSKGNIEQDALTARIKGKKSDGRRWASMPWFVSQYGKEGRGMIRRQCTTEYKLQVIDRFCRREILGLKPRQHSPKEPVIETWIGISRDEAHRIKPSREVYRFNEYPLIGYPIEYGVSMARSDCVEWLAKHYPARCFPKSACIGCPYRPDSGWREMRERYPLDWQRAVEFDAAIRKANGMRGETFTHSSLRPLAEAISGDQPDLFGNECEGMCGV